MQIQRFFFPQLLVINLSLKGLSFKALKLCNIPGAKCNHTIMMSKGSGPLDVLPCMACQRVKLLLHLLYGHLIYLFTGIVFFCLCLCRISVQFTRVFITFVFHQGLESKFLEFSFMEKHLLPSVPTLLACSSLLSGAVVLSILWWKYCLKQNLSNSVK